MLVVVATLAYSLFSMLLRAFGFVIVYLHCYAIGLRAKRERVSVARTYGNRFSAELGLRLATELRAYNSAQLNIFLIHC